MKQTWRWFGPKDTVSIEDIQQAGAQGIVTALHHIPTGDEWHFDEIEQRKKIIATRKDGTASHLDWSVVESLPVSEDIKKQSGDYKTHIENYKQSLHNLSDAGIKVVCYNFMPVLDWTRTDLQYTLANGARCMRFDLIDFIAFDVFILARHGAQEQFPEAMIESAKQRFLEMNEDQKKQLTNNLICGLPGAAEGLSLEGIKTHLQQYHHINEEQLRSHQYAFLEMIAPTAEKLGIKLCCHPDDPPFSLLGLPRIMSNEDDYSRLIKAVDLPANGITLCSGSLGAREDNDLPGMMTRLGDRVHFIHLRNVIRESAQYPGSFYESEHLGGEVDMVALIKTILDEEKRRVKQGRLDDCIPFRPDHGQDILDDLNRHAQPGYPSIGRLKGLAELRGIITTLNHSPL